MTSEFPFSRKCGQRFEQAKIIARMQTDRRLIEHVKHAAQIRAELRRQTNPLRLAAAQRFRRTTEREIAEADVFHEIEGAAEFPERDRPAMVFWLPRKRSLPISLQRFAGRERGEIVDRRDLAPARAARSDSDASHDRPDILALRLHRSIPIRARPRVRFPGPIRRCPPCRFATIAIPDFAEPAAFFAGAVRRIEREQTRIEFLEGAAAARTTHLRAHDRESMFRIEQMRGAAADIERALDQIARFQRCASRRSRRPRRRWCAP